MENGKTVEGRSCNDAFHLETRDEGSKTIVGYAAVYNSDSVDFGWFKEQIAPGAFARTLRENKDVAALFDHDTGKVIGRTVSGSLVLREDSHGLYSEITPPNVSAGNDALEYVRTGTISGMSIGMYVIDDRWSTKDGQDLTTI